MEKGKNADRLNAGLFPDFSVNQATEHLTSIFKPQALQKRFEKRLEIAHACGFLKFAHHGSDGWGVEWRAAERDVCTRGLRM
jgi:hypothetical protein